MASIGELVASIRLDTTGISSALASVDKQVLASQENFKKMAFAGTAALAAITGAVTVLGTSAGRTEDAMRGFGRSFGDVQKGVETLRTASKGAISDQELLITANKAALLGITNDVDKLAGLMTTARLRAKELGIGTTQAFDDIVTGIGRGSPLILDNLGIQIPQALKEMEGGMKTAKGVQALLGAVLEDGAKLAQQYGGDVITASDRVAQMTASFGNARDALGSALIPALEALTAVIVPVVRVVTSFISQNQELVANGVKVAAIIGAIVLAIGLAGKAFLLFSQVLKIVQIGLTATQLAAGVLGIAMVALTALVVDSFMKQATAADTMGGATDDLTTSMDEFGKNGVASAGNVAGAFEDAAKKVRDVQRAIDEENKSYEEQLASIVNSRRQAIADNRKALDQEQKDWEKKRAEMAKSQAQQTEDMRKQNSTRLADIEKSMAETLIVGSETYQADLANFQAKLEEEKAVGEQQIEDAMAKAQEETDGQQAQYDERTAALRSKIAEDETLLATHAEVIKGINLDVKTDEIAQLKDAHEKRLEGLNEQLAKEQQAFSSHLTGMGNDWSGFVNDANTKKINLSDIIQPIDWGKVLGDAGASLGKLVKQAIAAIGTAFVEIARNIALMIRRAVESIPIIGGEIAKLLNSEDTINANAEQMIADMGKWAEIPGYAAGTNSAPGGLALVGENGPEIMKVPMGAQIIPANETRQILNNANDNRNIVINNNITPGTDYDSFMLGFERQIRLG